MKRKQHLPIKKLCLNHNRFSAGVLITWLVVLVSVISACQVSLRKALPTPPPTHHERPSGTAAPKIITLTPVPTQPPTPTPTITPTSTMTLSPTPAHWEPLPPLPEEERGLITHGDRSRKWVALTFDLCQREGDLAGFDRDIIDVLTRTDTPATFFAGGLWMRDHTRETILLAENPLFELGNHSWSHRDFPALQLYEIQDEVLKTQKLMFQLTGYQSRLFRFPSGAHTGYTLDAVQDLGMYAVQWDVVSGDPVPNITAEHLRDWVLGQVRPGSIIIMHANGRGWMTAEALPGIIEALEGEGYTFVTISTMMGISYP